MSKHEHVTKEELVAALLTTINNKYAGHAPECQLRLPAPHYDEQYGRPPIDRKCNCGYTQWYLSTQQILDRANQ